MTSIWLLLILLTRGEPDVYAMQMPTMEQCRAAMPEVVRKVPEGAVVTCVELREEGV